MTDLISEIFGDGKAEIDKLLVFFDIRNYFFRHIFLKNTKIKTFFCYFRQRFFVFRAANNSFKELRFGVLFFIPSE